MIAAWMLYASVLGTAISIVALVAEHAVLAYGGRVRFIWLAALTLTVTGPVLAATDASREATRMPASIADVADVRSGPSLQLEEKTLSVPLAFDSFDVPLLIAWLVLSSTILGSIALGMISIARRRQGWRTTTLHGTRVLVTPDLGPAVTSVPRAYILLPEWALTLEPESLALMLRHEQEHVRARDSSLLLIGLLLMALTPWNPAMWWQLRRLRLAVEIDCDRRVVRTSDDARAYGSLLLRVGARRAALRIPTAALSEARSSLARRIDIMSTPLPRRPIVRLLAAAFVASMVLAVACDAPTPEPHAVDRAAEARANAKADASGAYHESQVQTGASILPGNTAPRYPQELRERNVEGTVLVRFVVDRQGRVEPQTVQIIEASYPGFGAVVLEHVPGLTFSPAMLGGRPVRQWVQQPFTFKLRR